MIIVKLDENNYFTGDYAYNSGGVPGGIEVDHLPPYDDIIKQKYCKWIPHMETFSETIYLTKEEQAKDSITGELLWQDEEHTIPIMITVPDIDEETGLQKTEIINVEKEVIGWVFDQEAYNNYINEKESEIPKETLEEKVTNLEIENLNLKLSLIELFEFVLGAGV